MFQQVPSAPVNRSNRVHRDTISRETNARLHLPTFLLSLLTLCLFWIPRAEAGASDLSLRVVGPPGAVFSGEMRFNPGQGEPVPFGPVTLPDEPGPYGEVFLPIPSGDFTNSFISMTYPNGARIEFVSVAFPEGGGPPLTFAEFMDGLVGNVGPSMWWPFPAAVNYSGSDMTQRLQDANAFADVELIGEVHTVVDGVDPALTGYRFGNSPVSINFANSSLNNPDPFSGTHTVQAFCQLVRVGQIPTIPEWGLIAMSLLLASGGTVVIARRTQAPPVAA